MARRRMHPVAEAALGIAAQVGEKAVKRAGGAAVRAIADSVLEDVGEVGDRARAVRSAIRGEPIEAVVEGVEDMRGRKRVEEEEEELDEEEEEEDEDEEEEEDHGKMDDDEFRARIQDAETLVRLATDVLEPCVKNKSFPRKAMKLLEQVSEMLDERLDDID